MFLLSLKMKNQAIKKLDEDGPCPVLPNFMPPEKDRPIP